MKNVNLQEIFKKHGINFASRTAGLTTTTTVTLTTLENVLEEAHNQALSRENVLEEVHNQALSFPLTGRA